MDIEKYSKARAHLEHIGMLVRALGIEENIWDMPFEELEKRTLCLGSSYLHEACKICRKEVSEVIRKRLIQEINEFREL